MGNAYLSSAAFWGASTNPLGASTPSDQEIGALALCVVAATFCLGLSWAARTLKRRVAARRKEAAEQARKRLEREERDAVRDFYRDARGGNSVVYATAGCDEREETEYVGRNKSGVCRRVERKTNGERGRRAEARRRAIRCVAFWTLVAAGFASAASLTTQNGARDAERVADPTLAEKKNDDANRWDDVPSVEIREVAGSEGARWTDALEFRDFESEWTETNAEAAQETPIDENEALDEENEDAENGESEAASNLVLATDDAGETQKFLECRAVSGTVVESPEFRRVQTADGELKSIRQIRAESSVEIPAVAAPSDSTYSSAGRASAENVAWGARRSERWGQAAAQSGQVSQFARSTQNLATAQNGQISQFAQPAQNLAAAQSGQVSQFALPAQNLATAQNGQISQFAQPAQNLATAQNGQISQFALPAQNLATARDSVVSSSYDERRGRPTPSELAREFTPSNPLIPFPSDERGAPIASVGYEERVVKETTSILEQIDAESSRIGERVRKSVLAIETSKRAKTKSTKNLVETGCGFLFQYKDKLYLATNMHVVKDATTNRNVKIFLPDQTAIHPTNILTCADFDLAALELDPTTLPTDDSVALCRFGNSDELRVSNFVGTIGNPFGLRDTATYGHVSSLQRRKNDFTSDGDRSLLEFIQLDATINPGNSGGPLYNARGEVVGVVAAIATTTGMSAGLAFAFPINLALSVLKSTIDAGGWSRSQMGVKLETASRDDFQNVVDWPRKSGSKIVGVNANSPAERAGLRRGDVVVEFDGEAIEDDVHFARLIAVADVSRDANVKFLRGAQLLETSARLERPVAK